MSKSLFKHRALVLVFAACLFFRPLVPAQESAPSSQEQRSEQTAKSDLKAEETGSADETAQFRHSGSVRLLSRVTGLSPDGAYWLAVLINFGVVVVVIVWLSKKSLPAVFRNRTVSIQKSIEEARRASEDANRRLSDIESRLGRLSDEIAQMRLASEKEAAAEEERIQKSAEEDAKRIVESAEQEIAAVAKAARRELTSYAADLAVTLATKQIHVDAPTDQALVRRFASQLTDRGNGKKA
ncbi:MAG TPA: ATP synthase F0 subunit B [Terriglobales bacterium]